MGITLAPTPIAGGMDESCDRSSEAIDRGLSSHPKSNLITYTGGIIKNDPSGFRRK